MNSWFGFIYGRLFFGYRGLFDSAMNSWFEFIYGRLVFIYRGLFHSARIIPCGSVRATARKGPLRPGRRPRALGWGHNPTLHSRRPSPTAHKWAHLWGISNKQMACWAARTCCLFPDHTRRKAGRPGHFLSSLFDFEDLARLVGYLGSYGIGD